MTVAVFTFQRTADWNLTHIGEEINEGSPALADFDPASAV
jgi:hypothetical protein